MIKYLTHKNIDKQKWDDCILKSVNGIIYAYSWYLDVVCEGWEALVEDDYKTVMPLTVGKKFGIPYIYPPFFTQQLGVFATSILSEETVLHFIKSIPSKFRFFEFNLNTFNKLSSTEYHIKSNINCELDLIDSYENLFLKFSSNTKRNVKKAKENDLTITLDVKTEELIEMFRSNRGSSIKNLKTENYNMLKDLVKRCNDKGLAKIVGVRSRNRLCAGSVFVFSKEKIIFLFSASNEEAKENGAMFFLIDHFIRENAQKNLILDFEGSNNLELARFYKSFGSKECTYLQVRKNNLPWYIRWMKEK